VIAAKAEGGIPAALDGIVTEEPEAGRRQHADAAP
jgi:hypothetical protein